MSEVTTTNLGQKPLCQVVEAARLMLIAAQVGAMRIDEELQMHQSCVHIAGGKCCDA
jgi:hypothetical protein